MTDLEAGRAWWGFLNRNVDIADEMLCYAQGDSRAIVARSVRSR